MLEAKVGFSQLMNASRTIKGKVPGHHVEALTTLLKKITDKYFDACDSTYPGESIEWDLGLRIFQTNLSEN